MSSLRPLATIALLAAVGVFLYMKINETEPKLSPELEEWSTSELEVGGDFAAAPALPGAAPDVTAQSAPPTNIGGEAPPFASAQLNPPAATPSAAPGGNAPAWSPGPTSNGPARAATPSTTADSSPRGPLRGSHAGDARDAGHARRLDDQPGDRDHNRRARSDAEHARRRPRLRRHRAARGCGCCRRGRECFLIDRGHAHA